MSADLHARIAALEDEVVRLQEMTRNMFRVATAADYDPEKDRVVGVDDAEGDDENGRPETPPIRVLGQSGAIKKRSTISAGEQLLILSPGGDFGPGSLALPLGPNADNQSPSNETEEDLTTVGETRHRLTAGGAELTGDRVELGATGGPPVARKGDFVLVKVGSSAGLWPIVTAASNTFAK